MPYSCMNCKFKIECINMYKYDATLTENSHLDHFLTKHKLLPCPLTFTLTAVADNY